MPKDASSYEGAPLYEWMQNMILYEVYVRNFSPKGTFKGVQEKLDYIQSLGVNTLWFMPIHPVGKVGKKGSLGCPYAVRDYMDVNPEYGTKKDFKELVSEIHKRGMKVLIDMVLNHTALDNVLIPKHPNWFYRDKKGNLTRRAKEWTDVVDIKYDEEDVYKYIKSVLMYWLEEFDIDGYRCDVAGMVPLQLWEEASEDLRKIKKDFFLLAEWYGSPAICRKAFNSDYRGEIYKNMLAAKQGKVSVQSVIENWTSLREKYPANHLPLNFIENHDLKRASKIFGKRGFIPWATLIFTLPGIPLIYNGQEIGATKYLSLFDYQPIDWNSKDEFTLMTYKTLISFRKQHSSTKLGKVTPVKNNHPQKIISYTVEDEKEKLLLILNTSPRRVKVQVDIPKGKYKLALHFHKTPPTSIDEKTNHIILKRHEALIFKKSEKL